MTEIIKAPEKKQRFKPMSKEAIIEKFNETVTFQNDNYKWGFTIDFIEDSHLIYEEEAYKNLQLGIYIREHMYELEDIGYRVKSYVGATISSVKVSW